jgi:adenine-specific DNA-methyltransferase
MTALRQSLEIALKDFNARPLRVAATKFLNALEYQSTRTVDVDSLEALKALVQPENAERLEPLEGQTRGVHVLFQLTADEVKTAGQTRLFNAGEFDGSFVDSYIFTAVELHHQTYTRTELAKLTRALNRAFDAPTFVIFKHGQLISIAVARRRLNLRDPKKDVLEKVTIIRDIDTSKPHPAHLRILEDLHLPELMEGKVIKQFVELERAWNKALNVEQLNKAFFKELSQWYFWSVEQESVSFPNEKTARDKEERRVIRQANLIRLITRLIFVWFLKEKDLVPDDLFNPKKLAGVLKKFDPKSDTDSTYYQSILQNLFFATLNTEMGEGRIFKDDTKTRNNSGYMMHNRYRYRSTFTNPDAALELFKNIPFLNGGLFECLDREKDDNIKEPERRIDGFSDTEGKRAVIPNELFFSDDDKRRELLHIESKPKPYPVCGILEVLGSYKFTVTENTPIEEEVALDPELLGKVFENLLAAYNPETQDTARKQTGSFYTPRDIVDFMVDESLIAYLHHALTGGQRQNAATNGQAPMLTTLEDGALLQPSGENHEQDELEKKLRHLLSYRPELPNLSQTEKTQLIHAIDTVKIIDPACGSGAFPMGVLQKLVFLLGKLDPENELWLEQQRAKLEEEIEQDPEIKTIKKDLETIQNLQLKDVKDAAEKEAVQKLQERIQNFNDAFDEKISAPDYARKLYLIENCIFGVDIQPIAVQIAKLRCFISLVVDQKPVETRKNRGILPLPNLETKFVAANTIMPNQKERLIPLDIEPLERELERVRHDYFQAKNFQKKKALRAKDTQLRRQMAVILEDSGWGKEAANRMAAFDPYNQNTYASFFDVKWMFGLDEGFDIVIGNPPYVRQEKIKDIKPQLKTAYGSFFVGTADLFVYFFKRSLEILKPGGHLSFICSNKYFRSGYGETLRKFLLEKTRVRQLLDFGDEDVFTAIAYPSIALIQNLKPSKDHEVRALVWKESHTLEDFRKIADRESFGLLQSALKPDGWRIEQKNVLDLLEKLRKAGKPLGEYVGGRFYRGILTGLNEAFVVDKATRDELIHQHPSSAEVLKPFLRGRDVKRWKVEFEDQYLIRIESSENKKHKWSSKNFIEAEKIFAEEYPAIYLRFNSHEFREGLIKRADKGQYFWELRSCAYWGEFEKTKIILPAISDEISYALDKESFFANDKTSICICQNNQYIISLLNSGLLWWYIQQIAAARQGGYFELKPMYVSALPIPVPLPLLESRLTQLVDYILFLAPRNANPAVPSIIKYLEQIIDALVYELYLPDILHAANRHPLEVISAVEFPALSGNENADLEMLLKLHDTMFNPQHPVRNLVYYLDSIPEIRIIEGKDKTA